MPALTLAFTPDPNATNYVVEYTSDGGSNWTPSTASPVTTSPVTVLDSPAPGTYQARLTAKGDGQNYLDSDPVLSSEVVVDAPAEKLPDPTIESFEETP